MFKFNFKDLEILVGDNKIDKIVDIPFENKIVEFLNFFSNHLIKDKKTRNYPDLIALSFWCRKKNITKFKKQFFNNETRLGRGLIFHITPSNVPTNFFYSLIFGLISGNSNIVRVPSKNFEQIKIICDNLNKIIKKKQFRFIAKLITIIRYDNTQNNITNFFSCNCDLRIIWGGDNTINQVRQSKIQPHAIDITFSDRYSFSVINSKKIISLKKKYLHILAKKFYNDTYVMDQNACSSPHVIFWYGNQTDMMKASKIFWDYLKNKILVDYDIPEVGIIDKFNQLCIDIASNINLKKTKIYSNKLHTVQLKKINDQLDQNKGKWGYFYEINLSNLNKLSNTVNSKYQTMTYFGLTKMELSQFMILNKLKGIDRIVPIGEGLSMSLYWDGYDIIKSLSRTIEIK
ncbi:hypothetical protein N8824_01540 [Candidatus Pelagibacter sp.]|nr:hypothetical protein [Candidatus Pelagibacter sp.]